MDEEYDCRSLGPGDRPDLPLLALDRGKPGDPSSNQNVVRVRWYNARPFVDLRSVYRGDGEMLHTKRGITVRAGEIDRVIAALQRAKVILSGGADPGDGAGPV